MGRTFAGWVMGRCGRRGGKSMRSLDCARDDGSRRGAGLRMNALGGVEVVSGVVVGVMVGIFVMPGGGIIAGLVFDVVAMGGEVLGVGLIGLVCGVFAGLVFPG